MSKRKLSTEFSVEHHDDATAHVRLSVSFAPFLCDEELAFVQARLAESIQDALRDAMRRLVSPTDADLRRISETAARVEEQLGPECAQTYMENTLRSYGPGRFVRDAAAGPWAIARVANIIVAKPAPR
jgi:hypothetical protein